MMTNGAAAGGGAAAAAAAIANAIKASGAIVLIDSEDFLRLLDQIDDPLVIYSEGGFLTSFKYVTSFKGFIFMAKSKQPLFIGRDIPTIKAKSVWTPS